MSKDDQQEAYEKALSATLVRVIDFLKFAEAKNAALLTFASAWVLGAVNLLTGSNALSDDWRLAFTIALPVFAMGGLTALLSFLPRLDLRKQHRGGKALLYFGDAARFKPSAYRDRIRERYYPEEGKTSTGAYLDDLAVQIAVNSKITRRKMIFFHWGAGLVLAALVSLAIPAIALAFRAACRGAG